MKSASCRCGRLAVPVASRGGVALALAIVTAVAAGAALLGVRAAAAAERAPAAAREVASAPLAWAQWQHLVGVVDIAGPRSDGKLVVVAAGRLFLVSPDGAIAPFAAGADGFAGSAEAEPYLVVAPALPAQAAGCAFATDDVFILDLGSPLGVIRVDPTGHASHLATIPDVEGLFGIAIDTTGRFGYQLVVTGARQGHTTVVTVDCRGAVTLVTNTAPSVEGGLVVAPMSFGAYGGDLIAPDELSGQVWAIEPDGTAWLILVADLPAGGDTGVESLGFVPAGFGAGGAVYLADRGTAGNPFPGTDSILRLSASQLAAAGVQEGDLLVATEGNGTTIAIRCADTCSAFPVADGPPGGHIEGHVTLAAG